MYSIALSGPKSVATRPIPSRGNEHDQHSSGQQRIARAADRLRNVDAVASRRMIGLDQATDIFKNTDGSANHDEVEVSRL
jgi:hypothetical protein